MGTTDDDDLRLPIKFGPVSNGEFFPQPLTPTVKEAIRRAHRMADERARRLGMSRRRFLSTLSGAAVTLVALNACSQEEKASTGDTSGGSFAIDEEATIDTDAAAEALAGEEFIMDVQTHFLDFDTSIPLADNARSLFQSFPQASCAAGEQSGDWRVCFSVESYLEEMFIRSDTTLAVISALPIPGGGNLPIESMELAKQVALSLCPEDRVLMHGGAYAHAADDFDRALVEMTAARDEHDIAAWKIYTMVGANPFYFDDHDPNRAQIGQKFIDHVREIGPSIICTHKGFKDIVFSDEELTSPVDIGPAAARNEDISFVIYHSGFEPRSEPGPYTEDTAHLSTNRLIKSLLDAGIEPNSNVYAELGGTWWSVMQDPDKASHVIGKLLKYVGEDRVVWGTDSIWFGTPQDQIQAFRTFEISEQYQEQFGYPALTPEIKAKIFGLNSAQLYGVDPMSIECELSREELQTAREELALPQTYGPETSEEALRHIQAHQDLVV
jgi:predicted TIM-barrel fold metal-dependent hydrolase